MRNQEGIKIALQEKVQRRIFEGDITFSQVIKIHNISMGGFLCDMENMKISCNFILAGWHL